MAASVDELYRRAHQAAAAGRSPTAAALLARDLTADEAGERSLLELEGLGEALWRGVDAQAYVHALRDEWDRRR